MLAAWDLELRNGGNGAQPEAADFERELPLSAASSHSRRYNCQPIPRLFLLLVDDFAHCIHRFADAAAGTALGLSGWPSFHDFAQGIHSSIAADAIIGSFGMALAHWLAGGPKALPVHRAPPNLTHV